MNKRRVFFFILNTPIDVLQNIERHTKQGMEQTLDVLLSHALFSLLLHMNTSKPVKASQLSEFIEMITHQEVPVQILDATNHEPDMVSSRDVSLVKARQGKVLLPEEQRESTTVFAGDTNFFVYSDGWKQWKKLERLGRSLTQVEIMNIYNELVHLFVDKKNGNIKLCWEVSVSGINGGSHTLSELIYVETKPVPKELFDAFFFEGIENGLLYSSNAHFACIEMLIKSGCIVRTSIVAKGEKNEEKNDPKKLARTLDLETSERIVKDILSSIPLSAYLAW